MKVVKYLHHCDLLLEDEHGFAIISGGHYVLSVGDRVVFKRIIEQDKQLYQVDISFASSNHSTTCEDQWFLKFEGCRDSFQQYLNSTTVH
ncbi:hypothetical protein NI467_13205 [Acinetobacter bohemicus]|uniref:hypothetical protein n=1 Tax=unclassified Acinetobacter TaxID=196816 RepID=UPI00116CDB0B|nr:MULTISPECIES: hypothetical protein [unclassified Acinetobacter]MCO8046281.1 hypothetical protein [Acinetobacter sp. S4397-1]TQR72332.1 hypothetical protein E2K52_01505 [Acinetobacter sp. RF14B]